MSLKEKAKALKTAVPALFLAMKRKDTPIAAKILAAITIGYALSPIDLIPDFIPVLGYLDDLLILPVLAALTIRLIPEEIMNECSAEAQGLWNDGKPKKWVYALPVVALWILLAFVLVSKFWK